MEVLSTDYGNFHSTPECSPNQSPASTSPSPEQRHSPRGSSHEQSLNIIVEPQLDGHTNYIHLMNPPTGQILSSFIAEHGTHIEIQPGVFFRVPFPHEHGYLYGSGPLIQPQPQAYQSFHHPNIALAHDINLQNNMIVPTHQVNPNCTIHGISSENNNAHCQQTGDERLDKRREKLQKRLREKSSNFNECSCYKHQPNYSIMKDDFIEEKPQLSSAKTDESEEVLSSGIEEPIIHVSPTVTVLGPYVIIVSWEECISNNCHLLACLFELQISNKGNHFKAIYSGRETNFKAQELNPGTEYSFRLCAILNGVRGPYSDIVSKTTLCTVPERPHPPRITQKTKNAITLKWTVPMDGGSPITFYKLQWRKPDDNNHFQDLYNGLQKQFKHNHKLPPGSLCMFRLQAGNSCGESEFSQILECLTNAIPPGVPERPELVAYGTNYISLKWSEPECNGAPVTEYKLEMEDPNNGYGFIVRYCGEKKSFTCQNLHRNTSYKFRLLVANCQGYSKHSSPVLYSTLSEAPGKMEKPKLNGKVKTHTLPVKWDPPKDTGGDDIIGYILEVDYGQREFIKTYHGPEKEYVIDRLQPGHMYILRVASEGKAGFGTWSPIASLTTLPVCPRDTQPPRLSRSIKPEMTALHLEWDPPLDTGGAKLTNYIIKMAASLEEEFKQSYNGGDQYCLVSGLQAGTDYFFKAQASNPAGASAWSAISTVRTAPGPPDAPSQPTVFFKSPNHVRLDWTQPKLHGTDVTGYCVEKLENEVFQKVYKGNCLFCDIKRNIEPASCYYFRVMALSAAGNSLYSSISTVETPPASPGPVTDIKVIEQTSNSCLIQWRHPVDNGSPVYEYVLEATGATSLICTVQRPKQIDINTSRESNKIDSKYSNGESDSESDDEETVNSSYTGSETSSSVNSRLVDDSMEYRLTGLVADASYRLRLQAINHVGAGIFSHPIQFFTKELPPSPPTLNISSSSYHSIKLKWADSASSKKALVVLSHTLQMQNKSGSFTSVYNGMGTSFTLSKLKELTPYCCRIRSKNDAGEGDFSKPKIFYTKVQPPAAIKEIKTKDITECSVNLFWNPCEKIRNDDTIEYSVQTLQHENSKDFVQIYRGPHPKYHIKGLKPDQVYQFRVHAIRSLSEMARSSVPSVNAEIKGVYSPICRVRTFSEASMEEIGNEDGLDAVEVERGQERRLSDTQIALLILGSFLGICLVIAIAIKWFLGEY